MGPFREDGFRIESILPWQRGFSECMGAMLANLHNPYIHRGTLFNEHTTIITVNIVVNNVVLVKQQ